MAPIPVPTSTRPVGTVDNVRFGEVVKAYPIQRYVDPANRRMMHERHVVYRVEADPGWRLAPRREQQLIIGNLVTDRRSSRSPITSQELTGEVLRSRAQNQVIATQQAITVNALGKTNSVLQSVGASNDVVLHKLAEATADLRSLKDRVAKQEEAARRAEEARAAAGGQIDPIPRTSPPSARSDGTMTP